MSEPVVNSPTTDKRRPKTAVHQRRGVASRHGQRRWRRGEPVPTLISELSRRSCIRSSFNDFGHGVFSICTWSLEVSSRVLISLFEPKVIENERRPTGAIERQPCAATTDVHKQKRAQLRVSQRVAAHRSLQSVFDVLQVMALFAVALCRLLVGLSESQRAG